MYLSLTSVHKVMHLQAFISGAGLQNVLHARIVNKGIAHETLAF